MTLPLALFKDPLPLLLSSAFILDPDLDFIEVSHWKLPVTETRIKARDGRDWYYRRTPPDGYAFYAERNDDTPIASFDMVFGAVEWLVREIRASSSPSAPPPAG